MSALFQASCHLKSFQNNSSPVAIVANHATNCIAQHDFKMVGFTMKEAKSSRQWLHEFEVAASSRLSEVQT